MDSFSQMLKKEVPMAMLYFLLFLAYLFQIQENEAMHWLSLVAVPLVMVYMHQRSLNPKPVLKHVLETFGLKLPVPAYGILPAIGIGLLICILQFFLSRDAREMIRTFQSLEWIWKLPYSFLLMVLTAGFTEEFFFRGFLQTRFQALWSNKIWAVLATTFCFGLYHLPYAYLHPRWPSHGDWPAAFSASFGQAVPMGLILGVVYIRYQNNLVACIILHALVNTIPAMLMIKF